MISFAPTILCLRLTCLAKSNLWRMTAWQILHWNNRGFKCIRSTWTLATPVFEYHCPQMTHWPRPSSLEATIWESKLDVGNICAATSAVPVTEDNPTNNNKVFVQNWFHEKNFLILLISRFFTELCWYFDWRQSHKQQQSFCTETKKWICFYFKKSK